MRNADKKRESYMHNILRKAKAILPAWQAQKYPIRSWHEVLQVFSSSYDSAITKLKLALNLKFW